MRCPKYGKRKKLFISLQAEYKLQAIARKIKLVSKVFLKKKILRSASHAPPTRKRLACVNKTKKWSIEVNTKSRVCGSDGERPGDCK